MDGGSCPELTDQEHRQLLIHVRTAVARSLPWGSLTLATAISLAVSSFYLVQLPFAWAIAVGALLLGSAMLLMQILMHECAHGTWIRSRRLNDTIGWFLGLYVLTPFPSFRRGHFAHHRFAGTARDPTAAPRGSQRGERLIEFLVRLRVVPVLYLGGVFWPYFTFDFGSVHERSLRTQANHVINLAVIAGLHIALGGALGSLRYFILLASAFWFSALLYEYLFTQNQHIGLLPRTSSTDVCRPREQHAFSRSIRMKFDQLFLYFNLHKEHHLCPQVPYRCLPNVHEWLRENRPDILAYTSPELGILSRRRDLRVFAPTAGDHDG